MALLKKEKIEEIVKKALKAVADFDGSINAYEFTHFHEKHKEVFLKSIKKILNNTPYYYRDGTTDESSGYDVPLEIEIIGKWNSMQDCIDFINENHTEKE